MLMLALNTTRIRPLLATAIGSVLLLAALPAVAAPIILTDDNSAMVFSKDATDRVNGMASWSVEGMENLKSMWFWYRVGPSGPEHRLDTLAQTAELVLDTNVDGNADLLYLKYFSPSSSGSPEFSVELTYLLRGGQAGSYVCDLAEVVEISNDSSQALDFHLFQYADWDVFGAGASDTAVVVGTNAIQQTRSGWAQLEVSATPAPSCYAVAQRPAIFDELEDASATTFANQAGPVAGDVEWVFEYDFLIPPSSSRIISKNIGAIPEPACLVLIALGGAFLLFRRRRPAARY